MAREGFSYQRSRGTHRNWKYVVKSSAFKVRYLTKQTGHFAIYVPWVLGWHYISSLTVLTSPNKSETAVHCCDPALSVLVMLVSRNVFHVVSVLQSFVGKSQEPKNDCRQLWLLARWSGWFKGPPEVFSGVSNFDLLITMIIVIISGRCFLPFVVIIIVITPELV